MHVAAVIYQALQRGSITPDRASDLYQEMESLSFDLTMVFNHQASTSLHKDDFFRILDTINYMFIHGFKRNGSSYQSLKEKEIKYFFYSGLEDVKKDAQQIQELLVQLNSMIVPFHNERYFSVLQKQVPDFLKSLDGYYAIFNYCCIEEDLDYPLFDDMPLYHDMYHLQGTDLVLYYLKRLCLENSFCYQFRKELPELLSQFENLKGVSIQYLGINLFGLVVYQLLAHILLYDTGSILLEQTDIERIKHKLNYFSDTNEAMNHVLCKVGELYSEELTAYLFGFKKEIVQKFSHFVDDNYELLIYPPVFEKPPIVILNPSRTNQAFFALLTELQSQASLPERIHILRSYEVNLYDLFELLENDIFEIQEYDLFFSSLALDEIAIMIKTLVPDLFAFHQTCVLSHSLFQEFDKSIEWQNAFAVYLENCCAEKKKEIEHVLNQIKIIKD